MSEKSMNEKSKTGRESTLEDFEKHIERNIDKYFERYEKSLLWKKFENYKKNLLCIQDVADRLLGNMKGHSVSFKPEITDGKGKFSQEKLSAFVDDLLSRWAEKQREGTFTDPSTGESAAEPYIRARQELYSCYLYLVMRCSLNQADYDFVVGGNMKLRTDFAFLLEQAKVVFRSWCVMKEPDGSKKNEMFWGYDMQFGLHLYRVLSGYNNGFDWPGHMPVDRPAFLTDEGYVKRNMLKRIYCGRTPWLSAEKAEKAAQPDEDGYDAEDSNDAEDSYDIEESYDIEDSNDIEDDYDEDGNDALTVDEYLDLLEDWEYQEERDDAWYEARAREGEKWDYLENLPMYFEYRDEYVRKCERFVELFRQAGQDVLRGFCEDLEEIVALYLAEQDIPPIMDTDKALEVYSSIYDGPCRRAERYARGVQWKNL